MYSNKAGLLNSARYPLHALVPIGQVVLMLILYPFDIDQAKLSRLQEPNWFHAHSCNHPWYNHRRSLSTPNGTVRWTMLLLHIGLWPNYNSSQQGHMWPQCCPSTYGADINPQVVRQYWSMTYDTHASLGVANWSHAYQWNRWFINLLAKRTRPHSSITIQGQSLGSRMGKAWVCLLISLHIFVLIHDDTEWLNSTCAGSDQATYVSNVLRNVYPQVQTPAVILQNIGGSVQKSVCYHAPAAPRSTTSPPLYADHLWWYSNYWLLIPRRLSSHVPKAIWVPFKVVSPRSILP